MVSQLVTAPGFEPVTLDEAKAHLRIEHTLDDATVTALIVAARQYAEEVCWRGFVTQTWDAFCERFPWAGSGYGLGATVGLVSGIAAPPAYGQWPDMDSHRASAIELPRGALVSVSSVKYVDDAGVLQTLSPSKYVVNTANVPGRIHLAYGEIWPTTRFQWDAVQVRYIVGTAVASVPQAVKQAILLLVSQMYEHRTPEVYGVLSQVQFAVDALLGPYRLARLV